MRVYTNVLFFLTSVLLEVLPTWATSIAVITWLTFNITKVWALSSSPPPSMVAVGVLLLHEHLVSSSFIGECFDALDGWKRMARNSYWLHHLHLFEEVFYGCLQHIMSLHHLCWCW
jgi:hypothetical protein